MMSNMDTRTVTAEVVTAPQHKYFPPCSMKVFLAGGIQRCIKWQEMVIDFFTKMETDLNYTYKHLYLLNPRRADWLDKPGEDVRQIEWEFDMIERCDLFTMYFAGGDSDQPICMYELGRNIEKMKQKFPDDWTERIIITCDASYKRLKDVLVQTRLATDDKVTVQVVDDPNKSVLDHCRKIKENLMNLYCPVYCEL